MNLRRSWRSDPSAAWIDAIFTLDTLVTLPALSLIFAFWLLVIAWFTKSLGLIGMPRGAEIAIALATGVGVDFVLSKRMSAYKRKPVSLDSFSSTEDSAGVAISFALSFAFVVLMLVVCTVIRRLS
jgi:hypothetical protein